MISDFEISRQGRIGWDLCENNLLYGYTVKKIICVRFLKNISTCFNKYRLLKKLYRKFRKICLKFFVYNKTYTHFYNYNESSQIICTVLLNHLGTKR